MGDIFLQPKTFFMKRILLPLFLLAFPAGLFAQYNPPSLPAEDVFDPSQVWDITHWGIGNANAFSLSLGSPNIDLYVATWDGGYMGIDQTKGGFLVRQYPSGTHVNESTTPTLENYISENNGGFPNLHVSSTEAGIIRDGSDIYVVLTYFGLNIATPTTGKFYLGWYKWDPVSGNFTASTTIPITPTNIPISQTSGWIHQDVDDNNEVVVTWDQGGQLYTRAGTFTSPGFFQLKGTGTFPLQGSKPDVAMMMQPNGQTDLYYAFTAPSNQQLYVYKANWNQLNGFPVGSTQPLPVTQLYQKTTAGNFGLPRIDAPNRCNIQGDEIWSVVAANHQGSNNFIFAASHSNGTGLKQQILNDGTLGGLSNISTGNYQNNRPTVSFSRQNNDLFYAWVFEDQSNYVPTYLSVKTSLSLGLLNSPSSLYFQIPYYHNNDRAFPAVGLSTNNQTSPYLFTSFIETPGSLMIFTLGLKTAEWTSNTGYRPAPTGIPGILNQDVFSVYPNPFNSGFSVTIATAMNQDVKVTVFNILGQKVYQVQGSLQKINKGLQSFGKDLNSGTYFIELKGHDGPAFRKEMIKW